MPEETKTKSTGGSPLPPKLGTSCFVIAPIGKPDSDVRKRSDQILRHIIEPACDECGLDRPVRTDKISESGVITTQVTQVIDDALVIADLSGHNPNVFYELALRHVLRKPVVQLIQLGEQIPFDIVGLRTIEFMFPDPDSIQAARLELVKHIRAIQADPTVGTESPVTMAVDLAELKRGNSQERELGKIADSLSELRGLAVQIRNAVNPSAKALGDALAAVGWGDPGRVPNIENIRAALGMFRVRPQDDEK